MPTKSTRNQIPTLPARLIELRQHAGLSREQLAASAGTSKRAIGSLELAERAPSLELAARIAAALGVSVDTLLAPAGSPIRAGKKILRKSAD